MLSLLRVRMLWLDVGIKIYTTDTKKSPGETPRTI